MPSPLVASSPPHPASPALLHRNPVARAPARVRRCLHCYSSKEKRGGSFADQILDYIEGGPKLRRWYGAPEMLPKDGTSEDPEEDMPDADEPRDVVLVTNGDSDIGQMVILSLILKRIRVRALVKDKRSAQEAFGAYVEPMVGNLRDIVFSRKALRGVRAIISAADDGFFAQELNLRGVQHIVLLSQLAVYRNSTGLQAIMNGRARKLAEADEEAVVASGIPYTIIRAGQLQDTPGGEQGFDFQEGAAGSGRISKEDAAKICAEAVGVVPTTAMVFEVANGSNNISDWKSWFSDQINRLE